MADQPTADVRRLSVGFKDTEGLRTLCGERDANLRWLESRLGIQVLARGSELHLQGGHEAVTLAAELLSALFAKARAGGTVDVAEMDRLMQARSPLEAQAPIHALQPRRTRPVDASAARLAADPGRGPDATRSRPHDSLRPRQLVRTPDEMDLGEGNTRAVATRSPGQERYVEAMGTHDVVFGVGPAGSGKTYLAMAAAVAAMQRREVKRIVLTRPAVEAGEHLGFLPGDLNEKVSPYLRPLYDALRDLVDEDKFERMIQRGQIEVAPLAYMRGRTLSNSFIILDEAQNCTSDQMLMLLTRMGDHSKMVVTGDPSQSDLHGVRSGLSHAVSILEGVAGIAIVKLALEDVVRHPLVGRIIAAFDADRTATHPDRHQQQGRSGTEAPRGLDSGPAHLQHA